MVSGAAQPGLDPCDIVLKGGLASGVVYASAVPELARTYRLQSIGGSSAGAVGVALAAACEYSRARPDGPVDPFVVLRGAGDLLAFDPRRLTAVFAPAGRFRRFAFWLVFGRRLRVVRRVGAAIVVVLVCLALSPLIVLALAARTVARRFRPIADPDAAPRVRSLALGTGMSPPRRRRVPEPGDLAPLTEWLHLGIQRAAGRCYTDDPLTFADVRGVRAPPDDPINVRFVCVDLALRRRVVFPDEPGTPEYLFDLDELKPLFPPSVIVALARAPIVENRVDRRQRTHHLRALPNQGLPLLVPARASAAFPGLLCPVPLWTQRVDEARTVTFHRHLLVDGGVAENFPISSFDRWVPSRPTFGLRPIRRQRDKPAAVRTLGDIGSVVFESLVNGRDNLQAELPGYRERNIDVVLDPGLGESNFYSTREEIGAMLAAGRTTVEQFVRTWRFEEHQDRRYELVMEQLEVNLQPSVGRPRPFTSLADVWPEINGRVHAHDLRWWAKSQATDCLLALVGRWSPGGVGGFDQHGHREATPTLRLGPR